MPDHIEDYRGVEIRRRKLSRAAQDASASVTTFYVLANGRLLAEDESIGGLKRQIDRLLDQAQK
jgi:hypothetical protein